MKFFTIISQIQIGHSMQFGFDHQQMVPLYRKSILDQKRKLDKHVFLIFSLFQSFISTLRKKKNVVLCM